MKLYTHPREIWDTKKCARAARRVIKDGLGTPYPWPGYIGQYSTINGKQFPLPIVAPNYKIIHVNTWGYRIIRIITDQELRETLEKINWSSGKGDITNITIEHGQHNQPMGGSVDRKFPYAGTDTRKFTIKRNTINFLRAQRTIF